jgi:hypothetical protein
MSWQTGKGWAVLPALTLALACAPPPPTAAPPRPVAPPAEAPKWPRFAELGTLAEVGAPFRTTHLVDPRWARLKLSPNQVDVYLELVVGTTLPVGTIVVEPLSLDDTRGPELYLGMEKTAEGWAYVQADADGRLLETHTGLCQRCHQEGVSDELFGPRRDLAPAPSSSP